MKKLIIIDKDVNIHEMDKLINNRDEQLSLFSLTSNFLTINKIKNHLQTLVNNEIHVVESCILINNEVTNMQKTIHTWSCELGNYCILKKTLKEWFLLPDGCGTSWWFGLISEKNSVQDDVFFKIAQMNAIKKHVENSHYDTCLISISDKRTRKILKKLIFPVIRKINILHRFISVEENYQLKIFNLMNQMGLLGAMFFSVIQWIVWLRDGYHSRRVLPTLKERITANNPFLFITYFPNIDEELAKKGIFHNKYGFCIQKKLTELAIPITWLLMPVFYNGHHFKSAMNLAKIFCHAGEKIFVLQEFFSFKIFIKSFWWWMRQLTLSILLLYFFDKKKLTANLTDLSCLPMIKYLWWHSFVGTSGTRGIIFYLTYLEIFKMLPHIKNCLYYCEMQAWEKALILAKKKISPTTRTLAFQHTVVMRNFFNYFYDRRETCQKGDPIDMPLPDKLLANGKMMHSLLSESNYPHLSEAEAVRQLYLNYLNRQYSDLSFCDINKPILLVVGSCDKIETTSLITMVYTAFPTTETCEIWFKGSPVNPVEPLFVDLGIIIEKVNYKILYDDISELLKLSSIALVANTTVAIEAIAFNCHLIIPVFADTMLMNPVIDTEAEYVLVSHTDQLKLSINSIIHQKTRNDPRKAREIIENYWNIDPNIPLWTTILTCHAII